MLIAIVFGALVGSMINATISYEDCKDRDFKPKACKISELMDKSAKK